MFAVFSTILQISVSQPVCRDALVCREISSGVPPNLKIPYITCKSCFFHNIGLLLHFGVPPTKKGWEPLLQMEDFSNNFILLYGLFYWWISRIQNTSWQQWSSTCGTRDDSDFQDLFWRNDKIKKLLWHIPKKYTSWSV